MLNLFKTRRVSIHGAYFGSHPKYPEPIKTLYINATDKGIRLWKNKTIDDIPWSEITGFDFEGQIINGVFYANLATKTGDIKLEVDSLHGDKEGQNQQRANWKRNKLNKFKRFVMENLKSAA